MNYFIGFLIEGEAARWHSSVAKDISEKFSTWKLHEKIPPHITILYPFSKENVFPLIEFLESWIANRKNPGNFSISDFDHFDVKVVFAAVETDQIVKDVIIELQSDLQKFPGMPQNEFIDFHLHATLANRVSPEKITEIWDYVQTLPKPEFVLPFDNVTLFRFEGDMKWVVEKIFRFK